EALRTITVRGGSGWYSLVKEAAQQVPDRAGGIVLGSVAASLQYLQFRLGQRLRQTLAGGKRDSAVVIAPDDQGALPDRGIGGGDTIDIGRHNLACGRNQRVAGGRIIEWCGVSLDVVGADIACFLAIQRQPDREFGRYQRQSRIGQ